MSTPIFGRGQCGNLATVLVIYVLGGDFELDHGNEGYLPISKIRFVEVLMRILPLSAILAASFMLGGCNYKTFPDPALNQRDTKYLAMLPSPELDMEHKRYIIEDPTGEAPGTIVIDSKKNVLYYVLPEKKAIRYGVATGTEAAGWSGTATIGSMAEWPAWHPPAEMIKRWPQLAPTYAAGGLPGGPDNPLGARALYLYKNGKDTLYRIHGTNEPEEIGRNVSSGCIRMRDIDVIDLYNRVKLGAKVIVLPA
jgi:lipoprotein-anchoring transpeptidase ErfK/SrfK